MLPLRTPRSRIKLHLSLLRTCATYSKTLLSGLSAPFPDGVTFTDELLRVLRGGR